MRTAVEGWWKGPMLEQEGWSVWRFRGVQEAEWYAGRLLWDGWLVRAHPVGRDYIVMGLKKGERT